MAMPTNLFDIEFHQRTQARHRPERDFLRDLMRDEVKEKLRDHARSFDRIAVIAEDAGVWVAELGLVADRIAFAPILDFPAKGYDLILHLGALNRAEDVIGQLAQARLNLAPDGVLIAAFVGGESLQSLRHALLSADAEISGGAAPRVAPMIDLRDAGGLLGRAGLALPVADHIVQTAQYDDLWALMRDLRDLGLTNPLANRARHFTRRTVFARAAEIYQSPEPCASGKISAIFELIFLTGYAPSHNQPQPKARGSINLGFGEVMKGH